MQQGTRYLQHVCQHSKTNKDVSLSNHVPLLKKSLETFVFRVKVCLAINNEVGSFWMGTLKNRWASN
jgi:Fanconi anemia group D2 protein